MTSAIPPSTALPTPPTVPSTSDAAAQAAPSFATSVQAASPSGSTPPAASTPQPAVGSAGTPTPVPTSTPVAATAAAAPVTPTQGVTQTAQVAQIVATAQAALSSSVNLSPQAQQVVKMEAFTQLVANLVNHIQPGNAALPASWPTVGVNTQVQALVTALLQQATANQPLPQQLVSVQAWPSALTNAVLQLAGQAAAVDDLPPALTNHAPQAALANMASAATKASTTLPTLQNWLVQQGTVQAADGERSFTLTLRVPVAWAQAQSALGTALPAAATPANAVGFAATPTQFATGFASGSAGGMLQLPFAGSVQQLSSGSMGLVMQPQAVPGSPAAVAAQAMRTSAILLLEFQPLAAAAQNAQAAAVYLPAHLMPNDVQAMLQNKATDPWVLMMQNQADENGKKQPRNANEHNQNFCNRAGCQYQGRAICAQPFCAEMNYLWSVDRAQRSSRL